MEKYGTEMGGTRSMHGEKEMRKNISWETGNVTE
jgi:hypothetical protein